MSKTKTKAAAPAAAVVDASKPLASQHAERLRVTRRRLIKIALELKRDGMLAESREERAEQFAAVIADEDAGAFESCRVEDGRDWESFFAALISFIEKIMPLILMFL